MFHQQNQPTIYLLDVVDWDQLQCSGLNIKLSTPNNITQHYTTIHTQLHHTHYTIHIKVEAGSGDSREEEVAGLPWAQDCGELHT